MNEVSWVRFDERLSGHEKLCEERWTEAARQTQDFRSEMRDSSARLEAAFTTGLDRLHKRTDEVHDRISRANEKWTHARDVISGTIIMVLLGLIGWMLVNKMPWG